jgi:molybdopterin converting factor small subunit
LEKELLKNAGETEELWRQAGEFKREIGKLTQRLQAQFREMAENKRQTIDLKLENTQLQQKTRTLPQE